MTTRRRAALRAAGTGLLTSLVLLSGGPAAQALVRDDGDDPPDDPLSVLRWLLWFVGIPAALFVLITLLVLVPELKRRRYGPGLGEPAEPLWIGPRAGTADPSAPAELAEATRAGGGASARW